MEVEAAAAAGAVQSLAHKVEPRAAPELKIRLQLFQRKAAPGGLGLLPAAEAEAAEPPCLAGMGQPPPVLRVQLGGQAAGEAGRFPQSVPQAAVQHPLPEGQGGLSPTPRGQKAGQRLFLPLGEQVHRHGGVLRAAPRRQQPRKLHDADAGQPVFGKLDLPFFPGQKAAALPQADSPPGPQAGQGFQHSGVPAAQRGQAGVKGLHLPAGPPGQGGAEASGAELGAGTAPQGADHVLGRQELAPAFPLRLDGVAAPFLAQLQHPAAGLHRHAQRLQPAQQQAGQVRRLVGIGIQPPCLIGPVEQAQPLPPGGQVRPVDGGQQPGQRAGGRGEIPPRLAAGEVVEVAAAVAGGQQLFAGGGVLFQQGDAHPAAAGLGRRNGRRQPRRAPAQDQDLFQRKPSRIVLSEKYKWDTVTIWSWSPPHGRRCAAGSGPRP